MVAALVDRTDDADAIVRLADTEPEVTVTDELSGPPNLRSCNALTRPGVAVTDATDAVRTAEPDININTIFFFLTF